MIEGFDEQDAASYIVLLLPEKTWISFDKNWPHYEEEDPEWERRLGVYSRRSQVIQPLV